MNYNKFVLKILALLAIAPYGIVFPMNTNPGGNNPIIGQPVNAQPEKTDAQKEEEKLSPEERAALQQEINDIQDTLDNALNETNDIDPQALLDEMDLGQYDKHNNNDAPNAFIPNLNDFIPGLDKTTKAFEKERERAQYQNTILLGHPKSPVALYRRDLMELPFFAADIAIAHLFFENIKNKRVDYVYRSLTEDTATYIELLTQIKEIQKSLENPTTNQEEAKQKLIELFMPIAEKHSYIGNNPFKLEVVMPFLSAILGHNLSRYAQEQCIVKKSFAPEAQYAYTQDKDGNYQRFEMEGYFATPSLDDWKNNMHDFHNNMRHNANPMDPAIATAKLELNMFYSFLLPGNAPMSTMSAIKWQAINNPNANFIGDQIPDATDILPENLLAKGMYKLAGLPNWLYEARNSRTARLAIEIAVLATITTHIDDIYNTTWLEHIEKNIDALLTLLHAYETVKHLPNENVEKETVCNDLLTFIQTGNTCASWKDACFKFFFHKEMGRMGVLARISAWTVTAVASSLLWKSRSLIKFGFTAAKNNMIPAEAWAVGGLVTAYMSLLIVPITLVSAVQVYQDACWIKDKIKDKIKSFFSKESDDQVPKEKQADTSPTPQNESNTPKEALA